ncbi:hypothetical protein BaRGS_00007097, partial [Batillaria attramentaria]
MTISLTAARIFRLSRDVRTYDKDSKINYIGGERTGPDSIDPLSVCPASRRPSTVWDHHTPHLEPFQLRAIMGRGQLDRVSVFE